MAEGFAKKYLNDHLIKSAGTNLQKINPHAIKVMEEVGINISNHESTLFTNDDLKENDMIITLCGSAKDECIINNSSTLGSPLVISTPATPPVWNVRIVSCVPGSPIDCAAIIPRASPFSTSLPFANDLP